VLSVAVGSVDQELFIFEGTVRENLTLWDPAVGDAALDRALVDACLRDDIRSRPGDLDGAVAVGGTSLSGGQRQRISLARALVRRPRLLLLDDATSAVDPEVEARILGALRDGGGEGTTLVVVAYRKATIGLADEVVFLENGRVADQAPHHVLLGRNPAYADLVNAYEQQPAGEEA
jgi:ABC-type multidrug transport system fused ATPase/permease subunit